MAPRLLPANVDLTLERHQARRAHSIPTVTVLAGPVGLGLRRWRDWASRSGRNAVVTTDETGRAVAAAWLTGLAGGRNLRADAVRWVAEAAGLGNPDMLTARLAAQTPHDFERFWVGLSIDGGNEATGGAARALLALSTAAGAPRPEEVASQLLGEGSPGSNKPWPTAVACAAALVPVSSLTALVLVPPLKAGAGHSVWFAAAAGTLAELALAAPAIPVGIAAPASVVDDFLLREDSRAAALLREGLVRVEGLNEAALAARLGEAGGSVPAGVVGRLAEVGVSDELAEALVEAASASLRPPAQPAEEDKARSKAERFLFELLDSLPETAGLFALNRPLEFRHGNAAAEADLVATTLRLVVEVDGGYFHLVDRDAYRRDRRKDWQYQHHGYLVLRFLAEDIFPRLEEVTETILGAVALRRATTADNPHPGPS
jgi:Protein of unknown function (DUF559)